MLEISKIIDGLSRLDRKKILTLASALALFAVSVQIVLLFYQLKIRVIEKIPVEITTTDNGVFYANIKGGSDFECYYLNKTTPLKILKTEKTGDDISLVFKVAEDGKLDKCLVTASQPVYSFVIKSLLHK